MRRRRFRYWHLGQDRVTVPKDMSIRELQDTVIYLEEILQTGYTRQMERAINKAITRFKVELQRRTIKW